MLPFLDKNRMSAAIMASRDKKREILVHPEVEAPGHEMNPYLKEAAADVLRAIDKKSVLDLAAALRAAFEVCDSDSQEEGEHMNEGVEE